MRIRHRSSCATLDCLISEIAVTNVSMADAKSLAAASCTARAMALELTVRFLAMISSNSTSLNPVDGGGGYPGAPAKNAGFIWAPGGKTPTLGGGAAKM